MLTTRQHGLVKSMKTLIRNGKRLGVLTDALVLTQVANDAAAARVAGWLRDGVPVVVGVTDGRRVIEADGLVKPGDKWFWLAFAEAAAREGIVLVDELREGGAVGRVGPADLRPSSGNVSLSNKEQAVAGMVRQLVGRFTWPRYVRGGIVVNGNGEVLVVRDESPDGAWGFPKWDIYDGEDGAKAAQRAVREQTGVLTTDVPQLLPINLSTGGVEVQPLGFGSPRYQGNGEEIAAAAVGLLAQAALRVGVVLTKDETSRVFDVLCNIPVRWETVEVYHVLAFNGFEPNVGRDGVWNWVSRRVHGDIEPAHEHLRRFFDLTEAWEIVDLAQPHASANELGKSLALEQVQWFAKAVQNLWYIYVPRYPKGHPSKRGGQWMHGADVGLGEYLQGLEQKYQQLLEQKQKLEQSGRKAEAKLLMDKWGEFLAAQNLVQDGAKVRVKEGAEFKPLPKPTKAKPAGVSAGSAGAAAEKKLLTEQALRQAKGEFCKRIEMPTTWKPGEAGGGGNWGRWFTDEKGDRWYVKRGEHKHATAVEALANAIYRRLGVPVAETYIGEGGGFLQPVFVSREVSGTLLRDLPTDKKEAAYKKLRKHFVADAFLGAWDVIGAAMDNIVVAPDGTPYRIDNGGALFLRARGGVKEFPRDEIRELMTMRMEAINPTAAEVFGVVTDQEIVRQAKEVVEKLDSAFLEKAVQEAGFDEQTGKSLLKALNGRLELLRSVASYEVEEETNVAAKPLKALQPTDPIEPVTPAIMEEVKAGKTRSRFLMLGGGIFKAGMLEARYEVRDGKMELVLRGKLRPQYCQQLEDKLKNVPNQIEWLEVKFEKLEDLKKLIKTVNAAKAPLMPGDIEALRSALNDMERGLSMGDRVAYAPFLGAIAKRIAAVQRGEDASYVYFDQPAIKYVPYFRKDAPAAPVPELANARVYWHEQYSMRSRDIDSSGYYTAGEIAKNQFEKAKDGFIGIDYFMYGTAQLVWDDGVEMMYWLTKKASPGTSEAPWAAQGHLEIRAPDLETALGKLKAIGLETKETTALEAENIYLTKIGWWAGPGVESEFDAIKHLPIEEQVKIKRKYLASYFMLPVSDLSQLSGYDYRPKLDSVTGKLYWEVPPEITLDGEDSHVLVHATRTWNLEAMFSPRGMVGNTVALLSSQERARRGILTWGASTDVDFHTGGADYVFFSRRRKTETGAPTEHRVEFVFSPSLMRRVDSVAHKMDMFGEVRDSYGKELRLTSSTFFTQGFEYQVRGAVPFEYLMNVDVASERQKRQVISLMKRAGLQYVGQKTPGGPRPVEDIVRIVSKRK